MDSHCPFTALDCFFFLVCHFFVPPKAFVGFAVYLLLPFLADSNPSLFPSVLSSLTPKPHPQPPPSSLVIWSLECYITFGIFALLRKTHSHFTKISLSSFRMLLHKPRQLCNNPSGLPMTYRPQDKPSFHVRNMLDSLRYGLLY